MSTVLPLARLLSRPSRQGRAAIVLPAVAFAVTTALLLVVAGGARMFLVDPRAQDAGDGFYGILASLALLLLAVPLVTLGAAAARLSSRRRNDRLATLRLLGASGREIWTLTVLEATLVAAAGAVVGVVLYVVLLPLVGLLPFFGGPVGMASVAIDPLLGAGVLVGVVVIAAVSAAASLRRVTVTPLGVRTRSAAPPSRRAALIVGLVALAGVALLVANFAVVGELLGPAIAVAVLLGVFAGGMALLNLVGAPIVAARGRAMARHAKGAAQLVAGRELAAHAGPSWRRVSGMAIVSFIAVVAGCGLAITDVAEGASGAEGTLMADIRTGVLLTLGIAFVLLACAVGVTQAASVLEERDLIVGLDRLGIPDAELRRARRLTVMVPLRWAAIGGAALGGVLSFPIVGISLLVAPLSVATIALTFVAGFALVAAALASTRPIVTGIRRGAM
ncbi:Ca2+/Na+ antiporter [Microbacterium testaceum StLB037]|uniref:Ca2+/Na+ antiporter n=1 Tax=Microbacterium testaceum (strain StLB037) TaxID=979556 RepID=E8NAE7_MICTS|nr:FtsX-like permease family protein [Microbacterium testaceum]BAJ74603.1 Ca2+/Na+ antiporter [Microbacterium testaceum StLB037]